MCQSPIIKSWFIQTDGVAPDVSGATIKAEDMIYNRFHKSGSFSVRTKQTVTLRQRIFTEQHDNIIVIVSHVSYIKKTV